MNLGGGFSQKLQFDASPPLQLGTKEEKLTNLLKGKVTLIFLPI